MVGISGRSAGAPEIQDRIMCIKCARRFHDEEATRSCDAEFHGKTMYRKCARCASKGAACLAVSTLIRCAR